MSQHCFVMIRTASLLFTAGATSHRSYYVCFSRKYTPTHQLSWICVHVENLFIIMRFIILSYETHTMRFEFRDEFSLNSKSPQKKHSQFRKNSRHAVGSLPARKQAWEVEELCLFYLSLVKHILWGKHCVSSHNKVLVFFSSPDLFHLEPLVSHSGPVSLSSILSQPQRFPYLISIRKGAQAETCLDLMEHIYVFILSELCCALSLLLYSPVVTHPK